MRVLRQLLLVSYVNRSIRAWDPHKRFCHNESCWAYGPEQARRPLRGSTAKKSAATAAKGAAAAPFAPPRVPRSTKYSSPMSWSQPS
jgi:hypothetical protein